jgi:hypothetical protein
MMDILLEQIKVTDKFRIREKLDFLKVGEYKELLDILPPVIVADIEGQYFLVDGFHRYEAARQKGRIQLDADVRKLSENEAYELAVQSNARHGLPLKSKERRKIAEEMLKRFTERSNTWIAEDVGIDAKTVIAIREELISTMEIPELKELKGRVWQERF